MTREGKSKGQQSPQLPKCRHLKPHKDTREDEQLTQTLHRAQTISVRVTSELQLGSEGILSHEKPDFHPLFPFCSLICVLEPSHPQFALLGL